MSWSLNAPRILTENAEVAEHVLERIRTEGPLSTLDFERGPAVDWFWAPTNVVRAVLEAYAVTGVLGLDRREPNRRHYDVVERLFPADLLARDEPLRAQLRHKLYSRFRAHGLLGTGGSAETWLGTGRVKQDPKRPEHPTRSELREELLEQGKLVAVEGVRGTRFVLRDEVELLAAPAGGCKCSASGERRASIYGGRRASSTQCAWRFAPTSGSQARPGSNGRRTSATRSDSSPPKIGADLHLGS